MSKFRFRIPFLVEIEGHGALAVTIAGIVVLAFVVVSFGPW
jgi:hypothetical protein